MLCNTAIEGQVKNHSFMKLGSFRFRMADRGEAIDLLFCTIPRNNSNKKFLVFMSVGKSKEYLQDQKL